MRLCLTAKSCYECRTPCKPQFFFYLTSTPRVFVCFWVGSKVWMCERACVFLCLRVWEPKVPEISDRAEYVFLSVARRMEKIRGVMTLSVKWELNHNNHYGATTHKRAHVHTQLDWRRNISPAPAVAIFPPAKTRASDTFANPQSCKIQTQTHTERIWPLIFLFKVAPHETIKIDNVFDHSGSR